MDSGPRRGTDWPAWRTGLGRPATTTPSGRAPSIRRRCRRRRCCRTTPSAFPTVEINYTFYRLPTEKTRRRLGSRRRRTLQLHAEGAEAHHARRRLQRLRGLASGASARPPRPRPASSARCCSSCRRTSRSDLDALRRVPRRAAAEGAARRSSSATRRGSTTRCTTRLRARNLALCVADSEKLTTPVEMTADYAYFRLRDEGYTAADIARWAGRDPSATQRAGARPSSTSSTKRRGRGRSSARRSMRAGS